jgi:hypothetical protein
MAKKRNLVSQKATLLATQFGSTQQWTTLRG